MRAWLAADRYQEVSELAFHSTGRQQVFCLCLGGRHNEAAWGRRFGQALPFLLSDHGGA